MAFTHLYTADGAIYIYMASTNTRYTRSNNSQHRSSQEVQFEKIGEKKLA